MVELPRVARFGAGWWPWRHARLPATTGAPIPHYDGACITCGGCGRGVALSGHQILADGTVVPSVVCPHHVCPGPVPCTESPCPHPKCTWHVNVRLLDWRPSG